MPTQYDREMVWHMCVVFSTMWLLCPKLVETSLSHFSRQSLQQSFPGNFGGGGKGGGSQQHHLSNHPMRARLMTLMMRILKTVDDDGDGDDPDAKAFR